MFKKQQKLKADVIRWHQFTRHGDAVFLSLGREIIISTLSVATLLTATLQTAQAQTSAPMLEGNAREIETDEVTVTASRVPLPMEQTARIVSVMTREQIKDCPAQSVNDLLKYAASVDVRQRGAFGIQTDISINGGTHDQIVILLNGVNISSPHTGHLAVDLPISIDDIERIEVLEGAASRVYGTSAFSGAINIVTKSQFVDAEKKVNGSVGLMGGSFGSIGADASVSVNQRNNWNKVSGGYQRSDGGTENSDFKLWRGFYQGGVNLSDVDVDWQLGLSGKDYGANTFYSGKFPNQYEENRRYMVSVSAQTKGRVVFTPTLYWNRSFDHYQLIKNTSTGENFHRTDVYGASVNATPTLVAELRDTSGLNTSGNGLGHDILLVIDNNPNWTWVLNSLFENAEGDYTAGRVMFTLPELPEGKHELMLRAWDVMNNSTTVYLGFKVVNDLKPKFSIDVTASPARENTSFVITHDRPGQNASVTIQVSSTDGMLQWSKTCRDESGSGVTVVDWNLHGNSGHRMQPGLYIVRAIVGTDGGGSSSASCKLVIVGR